MGKSKKNNRVVLEPDEGSSNWRAKQLNELARKANPDVSGLTEKERKYVHDIHIVLARYVNVLYTKKNHDYGNSFHETFVEEGLAMARIRLGDKLARFNTLTKEGGQQVNDESIRDTLIDLANYAIMTVMELDKQKDG